MLGGFQADRMRVAAWSFGEPNRMGTAALAIFNPAGEPLGNTECFGTKRLVAKVAGEC